MTTSEKKKMPTASNATTLYTTSVISLRIVIPIETSFFVVVNCCLFIALCFRFHTKPVKAHGRAFLLSRLFGSTLLFLRYVIVYAIEGEEVHDTSIWQQLRALSNVILVVMITPIYSVPFFLQFWRILHVFEYNRIKAFINTEETSKQYYRQYTFHKFVTSIWFNLIVIVVSLFFYSTAFVIGTVLAFVTDLDTTTYFVVGFGAALTVFVIIPLVTILLVTLFRQSRGPYFVFTTAFASLLLISLFAISQIGSAFKNRMPTDESYLLFNIFITAIPLYLMLLDVVVVVGVPIIQSCIYKNRNSDTNSKEEIEQWEQVLSNKTVEELFIKFCTREWSSENVLFYKQCSQWQTISSSEEKLLQARVLYSIFLDKNAPLQLNTTTTKVEQVQTALQSGDLILLEKSFVAILNDCKLAMSDTFSRFRFYDPYVKYKKRNSAKVDASKQVGWQ